MENQEKTGPKMEVPPRERILSEVTNNSNFEAGPGAAPSLPEQHRMYTIHKDPFEFYYGKWLWFSNGDIELQSETWEKLKKALAGREELLESSRTGEEEEGVIKYYAKGGVEEILKAGLAFQKALEANYILFFKTNESTKEGRFERNHCRTITKFMLTPNGKLYERGDLGAWEKVHPKKGEKAVQETCTLELQDKFSAERGLPFEVISDRIREAKKGLWQIWCDFRECDSQGSTELDRVRSKAIELCNQGLFKRVRSQTKDYAEKRDYKIACVSIFLHDWDTKDISSLKKTGCTLIDHQLVHKHSITYLTSSTRDGKPQFKQHFKLFEDKDFM